MNRLVLTEEQARLVRESLVQMIVLDPNGELLGFFNLPITPERVAELKRRAKEGPFFTTEQVLAGLEAKVKEEQQADTRRNSESKFLGAA